jgi:hypothetical protein
MNLRNEADYIVYIAFAHAKSEIEEPIEHIHKYTTID